MTQKKEKPTTLEICSIAEPGAVAVSVKIPKERYDKLKAQALKMGMKPQPFLRALVIAMIDEGATLGYKTK